MPKTRPDEDRDAKAGAIVEAALRRLRDGGPAAFSVAAIARELGLAQNTIYWYFPSKDELFVAAMRRLFSELVEHKRAQRLSLADEIVWFVERLRAIAPLRAAMAERARQSPVVAEFAAQFQQVLCLMLGNSLRPYVDASELDDVVGLFVATLEGLQLQTDMDADTRRRLIGVALERLTNGQLQASTTTRPPAGARAGGRARTQAGAKKKRSG